MNLVTAQKCGISFGDTVLFSDVSFSIQNGEKVALVGVNGAGKTTLMNAILDPTRLTTGEILLANRIRIAHLSQYDKADPEWTVLEGAENVFISLKEMEKELDRLTEEMKSDHSESLIARFTAMQQRFQREGGYEYKSRARGTLIRLGFSEDMLQRKIKTLSGGQKTILNLSLILLEEPDLMLLDEPTNHLDIGSLEWLEEELRRSKSAVLVISHDRLFLDRVTTKTLELENGRAEWYACPYARYREEKKKRREVQEKHYQNQQKEIAQLEAFIAQQKRWNRERNIIAAESRQKALDRMEKVEKVAALPDTLSFRFSDSIASGEDVLKVQDLTKAYGKNVLFSSLSFEVKRGDRLLIVGANGSGKSTLLQILAGRCAQDAGSFSFGYNVRLGYYDQYQRLNEENTVLEEIWQDLATTQTEIRKLLATFLFRGDDVAKRVAVLSGGERARLVLAKLMQKKVNVLLLDEPTNHLDIESREALEDAILQFEGTVIAVSHDRYFIHKIATRSLSFEGNGTVLLREGGDLSAAAKEATKQAAPASCDVQEIPADSWEKRKEKRRSDRKSAAQKARIEKELEQAEARLAGIAGEEAAHAQDYEALQKLYEEKEALEIKRDNLLEQWLELEEKEV